MNTFTVTYHSPIGPLALTSTTTHLTHIDFEEKEASEKTPPVLQETIKQLDEYFARKRKTFDLPLLTTGTPFQLAVWDALQTIPYGETRSYKDIALLVKSPLAVRAVGMTNHVNKLPIVIPCHRVIGINKKPVGYGGGLDKKLFLLALEQQLLA